MTLPSRQRRRTHGNSWVEVLVVLAVLVVGAGMLLPAMTKTNCGAVRIACVNNLKQIGTAFRIFANDYDGAFPYQVLYRTTNALPAGFPKATDFNHTDPSELWKVYLAAQNELGSPRILVCPQDNRSAATTFTNRSTPSKDAFDHPTRRLNALSYFYGLTAKDDAPNLFVAGDRNFTTGGTDIDPGKTLLTGQANLSDWPTAPSGPTAPKLRWSSAIHGRGGNVVFSDGSAQQLTSGKLRDAVANTGTTNNPVWLPNLASAKR